MRFENFRKVTTLSLRSTNKSPTKKKYAGTQNCGPQTCVPQIICLYLHPETKYHVIDFGSKAILDTYNLGTKSNISRIKAALLSKEMIDFDKDNVFLEDPVFKI